MNFTFDGAPIEAHEGETIAAALTRAGVVALGRRRDGSSRGVFCGMGVCQECIVSVDGVPSRRACMEAVVDGTAVASQGYAVALPPAIEPPTRTVRVERPQVLIVGAGPAGLAAARASALCGASVTVIDERAKPGGQFFKQRADGEAVDAQMREGRELVAKVIALGVTMVPEAAVWGAFGPREIAATVAGEHRIFAPERLVLATGVYERGIPMRGWTLPGCMTTGAAQTLLRAHGVTPGRRILVAGNGPLNFQLAAELVEAGVHVVAVVEAARRPSALHALRAAAAAPRLIARGLRYLSRLTRARVPIHYRSAIVAVQGTTRVESCTVDVRGKHHQFDVDAVCIEHGFLPVNEIARALGCRHDVDAGGNPCTLADAEGQTTIAGVYAVGDAVAFRGAHVAQAQGFITGTAVARALGFSVPARVMREVEASKRGLARHLSFQRALWQLFAAPRLRHELATPDTIVCRCENVCRGTLEEAIARGAASLGALKRRTRAGMGRCQGRYCESILREMLPESAARDETSAFAPRAPVKPVRIEDLA